MTAPDLAPAAALLAGLALAGLAAAGGPAHAGSEAIGAPDAPDGRSPAGDAPARPGGPGQGERRLPAGKEAWPVGEDAIGAVRIITGRPLDGADCRDVIFENKPMLRQRLEVADGQTLVIPLGDLCLFGLRNDSEDRTILVRVGESFDAVAITADSRLFSGLELGPYQQVAVPVRPLAGKRLAVSLETLWADQRRSPDGRIQSVNLVFDSR